MNKKSVLLTCFLVFLTSLSLYFATTFSIYTTQKNGINDNTIRETQSLVTALNNNVKEQAIITGFAKEDNVYISFYHDEENQAYLTSTSYARKNTSFASLLTNLSHGHIYYDQETSSTVSESFAYSSGSRSYIRYEISVPTSYFVSKYFLIYGMIVITLLNVIGSVLGYMEFKKSLKPLQTQINKLQRIVTTDKPIKYDDDVSYLAVIVRDSRKELEEQFNKTKTGEQKIDFILDSISQGLLVIDASYKVVMINKTASNILNISKLEAEGKNMENLSITHHFEINVSMVIQTSRTIVYNETIGSRIYQININPIDYSWTRVNEKNGASVLLIDITDEYNSAKMKRDFVDNAAHELKSPLTSILGYQQMMKENIITSKEDVDNAINISIKECVRMNKIIIDMLSLSSLENEDLRPVEEIEINNGIKNILGSLEPQIESKHIQVLCNNETLVTKMNYEDFDKLIRNLLDNAIKYNVDKGSITITINAKKKTLSIKDTGIGVALENQSRIFERFYRVDKARSRENGGTGLGLAIVKHICNYYEDKIDFASELGKGTTFTITFS
jgi:two-component system phosphate regulon sensor histidine kinase PhoR